MAKQKITVQKKSLGIYVHIPFCRSKCVYCDFYSLPKSQKTVELMDRYVKALQRHIREGGARAHHLVRRRHPQLFWLRAAERGFDGDYPAV